MEEAARARRGRLDMAFKKTGIGEKTAEKNCKRTTNDLQELMPKDSTLAETHAQKLSVSAALPHRFRIETDRVIASAHCSRCVLLGVLTELTKLHPHHLMSIFSDIEIALTIFDDSMTYRFYE